MEFMKIKPVLIEIGNLEIRYYAICILIGVIATYYLSRWCFKRGGYDPDICDDIILFALPSGILGARIWWCIADSGSPWHNGNFWGFITEFRDGGLAIQGGVILGVLAGVLVVLIKHKNVKILYAMDAVIPNILAGQILGRWGNFFNQEVYGSCVEYTNLDFLPDFIQEQMRGDVSNPQWGSYGAYIDCASNQAAQPLFLYESLLNLIGIILITFVLRKYWNKGRKSGDLACIYFIWYGIVRFIMEPLRNSSFIMGDSSKMPISQVFSLLFIIGGVLAMVAIRVVPKLIKKHD